MTRPDHGPPADSSATQTAPRGATMGSPAANLAWRLHVLLCPDPSWRGRVLDLPVGTTVLGRHPNVPGATGLAIADPALSREHASIEVHGAEPGPPVVTDLGSRNGTWLEGATLRGGALGGDGAVVRLGGCVAVLEADQGDAGEFSQPTDAVAGVSRAARVLRQGLARAAAAAGVVLLVGETGTGKEAAGGAVHGLSLRRGPLIRCNVAAVPAALFEAELFGHARGAFTGAGEPRAGLLREAAGGTLFLDEIAELAPELQPKLLRVLDDGRVRPVGGKADVAVDVRFVAATNADLDERIAQGRMRRDLAARLRHAVVELPPLRARRPDLVAWCDAVAPRQHGSWSCGLSPEVAEALLLFAWPDNLRQLRRALCGGLASAEPAGLRALPDWLRPVPRPAAPLAAPAPEVPAGVRLPERFGATPAALRALLVEHAGNVEAVARALGRDRRQIYRWLAAAGIDVRRIRAGVEDR